MLYFLNLNIFAIIKHTTMDYKVSNIRRLMVDDLPNIPKEYRDMAFSKVDSKDYSELLKDEDYMIATLTCPDGTQHTLLHGFPDDDADGIIYDNDLHILVHIGYDCGDVNDLTHWYISLGEEAHNNIFTNLPDA
jgi:hypothetical protein